GIYPATPHGSESLHYRPISERGPLLSDHEAALLATLSQEARSSRLATHAELRAALLAMAERHDYALMLEITDFGFTATVAKQLRVVAHTRGTGEETFYCQVEDDALLRELGEEIARVCGPQLLLPVSGDSDGVLVVARS
ncbi:MAG TPA: hypothetical protein VIV40_30820, partial [Kofleriaceae bacterium]